MSSPNSSLQVIWTTTIKSCTVFNNVNTVDAESCSYSSYNINLPPVARDIPKYMDVLLYCHSTNKAIDPIAVPTYTMRASILIANDHDHLVNRALLPHRPWSRAMST